MNDAGKAVIGALAIGARRAEELSRLRFVVTDRTIEGSLGDAERPLIPQIAIPTTLSAAEYNGAFAMSSDGVKDGYTDIRLTPRVVVLDPRAALETPDRLWGATGKRSNAAAELLRSQGISDCRSLRGGLKGLKTPA